MIQSADDQLDELIREIAHPAQAMTPEMTTALDDLGQSIIADGIASKSKKLSRRRYLAVAGIAAVSLSIGVPAAADWLGVRTGLFGEAGHTENDTTEWLRLDSPELDAIVDQFGTKYPLPAGGDWTETKKNLHGSGNGESGLMQESGVELTVAMNAQCQWQRSWLNANAAGDQPAQTTATEVLNAIPNWQIIKDHDGGGVVEMNSQVAVAAIAGDRATVTNAYNPNCADTYGPVEK
jgi:hypothetical protein